MVLNHIKSNKQENCKQKLAINKERERDLHVAEALEKHDAETHRKRETLPEDQKIYRA